MLVTKFEELVKKESDKLAVKTDKKTFTYDELNKSANMLAHIIKNSWPEHSNSSTVGLLFEHGAAMITAIIGILKAGKIYVPLSPEYPVQRLSYIASHSDASMILTDSQNMTTAEKLGTDKNIQVLNFEEIEASVPYENPVREILGDKPAYILYTSGSTGKPKGVIQTHENVLYFIDRYTMNLSITKNDHLTLLASLIHDAAVMDIYGALLNGATLYPLDIKKQPDISSILKWLDKNGITIWHSVPTLYRYFVNHIEINELFPMLRLIVLGGDQVLKNDIDMCRKLFPNATLCNLYGQTESSYNSTDFITPKTVVNEITIGEPVEGTGIFVVDKFGNEVAPLETGEIVIASPHVALGYFKDEDATKKSFYESMEFGRLYLTGDLGRPQIDRRIEFVGRKDSQVKIRGYRVELGDIENQILEHDKIKEAVVIFHQGIWENTDYSPFEENFLCAYIVSENELFVSELRDYLSRALPFYMIPLYFKQLEKMPLTPSGKVDRMVLSALEVFKLKGKYEAPRDEVEEKLVEIWSEVLRLKKEKIGIDANFFDLGGHSLTAMNLAMRIHRELDMTIQLMEFFNRPTIKEIAEYIKANSVENNFYPIEPFEKKDYYPLSSAQKRLYIIQQIDRENTINNMPMVLTVIKNLEEEKLEETFCKLIERHESLRTSFELINDEPVQRIHEKVIFRLEHYDAGIEELDDITKNFIRPFDISKAPLLRIGLLKIDLNRYQLMVDLHHIISDGTSNQILIQEFLKLYAGEELLPLKFQCKDYTEWHNKEIVRGIIKKQEEYWLKVFERDIPNLDNLTDYSKPSVMSYESETIVFEINRELSTKIKILAAETESTLFIVLMAVYNILLAKYTGEEDIVVGSAVRGRTHADLQNVTGMFVNMLAIRNRPEKDKNFMDFLKEVKKNVLNAYANQDYQFDELVAKLKIERKAGRNPLFDTHFMMQHIEIQQGKTPEVDLFDQTFRPNNLGNSQAQFDLSFAVTESKDTIIITLEYRTALYKRSVAEGITKHYIEILEQIVENRNIKLTDITISHDLYAGKTGLNKADFIDF